MKICFHLQRRFAYVGHEIALLLKERHGVQDFCGYVFTRGSYEFLNTQNDFKYTSLLLDDAIHEEYKDEKLDIEYLKKIETEYGIPNLWPYIDIDRVVRYGQLLRDYPYDTPSYTHEEMLRILQVKAKRVIEFLDREKPDIIFFSAIGAIASLLMYHIAKKKGIRTYNLLSARIKTEHLLSEHYSEFTNFVEVVPTEEDYAKARAFIEEFRAKPAPYTDIDTLSEKFIGRFQHFNFLIPHRFIASLRFAIYLWTSYFKSSARHDYATIKPWNVWLDRIKRKMRVLIGYDDLYDRPQEGAPYIYFPLHFEPEIVTLLYAPIYKDQLWVIKQIARSLPVGYKLYIKEHLAMFGFRTRAFYKELKKIPNVVLINPHVSSFTLIKGAELIVTLTGTVGWEALLMKKPVITFGEIFYNPLSGAHRCRNIEDLPRLIQEQLNAPLQSEEELIEFVAKIYRESVPLDLVNIWERERSGHVKERRGELVPLADLLFKKASHATLPQ